MFWKPLHPQNWTAQAVVTREVSRSWPILLGFAVAFGILGKVVAGTGVEQQKESKYYQQIANWGKKDDHHDTHGHANKH